MKRIANAHWSGSIQDGQGTISSQSTVLQSMPYSFRTRFADGVGTNPEELLAAAHAGCFTMAVSAALAQQGFTAGELDTSAVVDFDPSVPAVTGIRLELTASVVEGLSEAQFTTLALAAKENCPISKALAATPITLEVVYR